MTKTYNIGTVKMAMMSNGYPQGFVLKREPTVREAMHILRNILGFNVDLSLDVITTLRKSARSTAKTAKSH